MVKQSITPPILQKKLEQLSSNSAQASEINVAWNAKTEDYVITFANNELVRINEYVILPDSTEDLAHDALQATNRLRRLMGNATPLKEVKGQPKVVAKKTNSESNICGGQKFTQGGTGDCVLVWTGFSWTKNC